MFEIEATQMIGIVFYAYIPVMLMVYLQAQNPRKQMVLSLSAVMTDYELC